MRWILFVALLVFSTGQAGAQEFSFLADHIHDGSSGDASSGWQLEFANGAGEHFKYSFSYINEGHATTDHRDGIAGQIWARTSLFDPRFVLSAGAGPYYYFNTISSVSPVRNEHRWGGIASGSVAWYTKSRWFFQLRTSWIEAARANTLSEDVGIGYLLEPEPSTSERKGRSPGRKTNNEITLFFGDTIVNNPERSGHYSNAECIEYRRELMRHMEWTVGLLHEDKNQLIERSGLLTQLWAADAYFGDRLTLAAGLGPYAAEDRMRDPQHSSEIFVSGIVTLSTSFRFLPLWDARFSWSRIITDYERDADLLLLGIGRRF